MSKHIDLEKLRKQAERGVPLGSSQILELVQYIAALEKDAERYQFLRDSSSKDLWGKLMNTFPFAHSSFDIAIDTAMEASNAKAD